MLSDAIGKSLKNPELHSVVSLCVRSRHGMPPKGPRQKPPKRLRERNMSLYSVSKHLLGFRPISKFDILVPKKASGFPWFHESLESLNFAMNFAILKKMFDMVGTDTEISYHVKSILNCGICMIFCNESFFSLHIQTEYYVFNALHNISDSSVGQYYFCSLTQISVGFLKKDLRKI